MAADGLRVHVSDLLRHPGIRRAHVATARIEGMAVSGVMARPAVELDLVLESLVHGLLASGHVRARWDAECARCLEPVEGELDVEVRELFEPHPAEGESYPLGAEVVDLEPMVRDAVGLELPLVPRHAEGGCAPEVEAVLAGSGPGADAEAGERDDADDDPQGEPGDPRWAALRDLRFQP